MNCEQFTFKDITNKLNDVACAIKHVMNIHPLEQSHSHC